MIDLKLRGGQAWLMPALNLGGAALLLFAVTLLPGSGPAKAQNSCQATFEALNKKLEGQIASLNAMQKGKKKQMDPQAACPKLRTLSATERELLAYMKKEQSWCNIPEELIQKFTERVANTSRIAGQACKVAAQQAQMRRQAEQGGGPAADTRPKLPTGPL